MVFEDLDVEEFAEIAKELPKRINGQVMKRVVRKISEDYCMNEVDSSAAFLIAHDGKHHFEAISKIVERRVEDLTKERIKAISA
jgi:hypothetical protein